MNTQELLLLENEEFRKKVDYLFAKLILDKDENYLQVYLNNPSELFVRELLPDGTDEFPAQEVSDGNRFLFSVLSNSDFLNWLKQYQEEIILKLKVDKTIKPNKAEILKDLAGAMVQYGDKEMAFTFLNAFSSPTNRKRNPKPGDEDVAVAVLVAVAAVVIVVVVIAPIALISLRNNPLTEPIMPANITAQQLRALADQLTAQAEKFKTDGKLLDLNYDFN